ncbi:hypothetical protein Q3G72_000646 [Acer saccharum]|nr:hypothetical protein Q3G72_000646 [Acer saccharum]
MCSRLHHICFKERGISPFYSGASSYPSWYMFSLNLCDLHAQPISDAAVPKSQVQAQAQPILTVPKSKRRTRRPVRRPKKVQVQAQPILDAVGEADASVPKSQVQAQAQPILTVPKSKRMTRRPVGRPRNQEELDLKERQLTAATAANEKSTALTAKLDLKDRQLTAANEKLKELEGNIRVLCRVRPLV